MKAPGQTHQAPPKPQAAAVPFRRRLKHWKQRFDAAGVFVWAKCGVHAGERIVPGTPVDKASLPAGRLRRLWQTGWVQRTDWNPRMPMRAG